MTWNAKIDRFYAESPPKDGWECRPDYRNGAADEQLEQIESEFRCQLSVALRSLLKETDGVMNMMAIDHEEWFDEGWLIWPAEEIVERNIWLRNNNVDRHLERYLFFSSPGVDGIMFGCPVSHELKPDSPVYAWYPDETEDKLVAESLDRFLQGWIVGQISV